MQGCTFKVYLDGRCFKKDSWTSLRGGANGGKVGELETLEDHPGTTWSENTGAELTHVMFITIIMRRQQKTMI